MRNRFSIIAVTTVAALGATAAAGSAATPPATVVAAATSHFEGTVVSVNRADRSFRLRDSERGTVRIRVTGSTRFERIAGFAGLRRGMTRVESTVRRAGGTWVATSVERSGGGGRHGGRGRED
jgi:hypothetical protein